MLRKANKLRLKRVVSLTVVKALLLGVITLGLLIPLPTTEALVNHDIGNLKVIALSNSGRIFFPMGWPTQSDYQCLRDYNGITFAGLVIDQDNYNHTPGGINIADSFKTYPSYNGEDDFRSDISVHMLPSAPDTQKSFGSFYNKGTEDPNDIYINQTAWSVQNKDWFIIQWQLINQKNEDLTGVSIGLEVQMSQVGVGIYQYSGVGEDSGDDTDGFDSGSATYYVQDTGATSTCFGFASAVVTNPIDHYYSVDYGTGFNKSFWENDTWLYERLTHTNEVVGLSPGNRTSVVGWKDFTIPIGSSKTFTLVMAINDTYTNMIAAVNDAQSYYHNVASGFRITEFSDSSSPTPEIEIYNMGRDITNLDLAGEEYRLSVNGGPPFLTGSWTNNPVPTYEYATFQTSDTIGPEGDTIGLYHNIGGGNYVLVDEISYGQDGVAPDPISGESVARRFNEDYMDEWLRNASSGDTFGSENNVGAIITLPEVVINRVMFNPNDIVEGYVELMYTGMAATKDISGYKIVCDEEYVVPPTPPLSTTNRFFVLSYSDMSTFFDDPNGMTSDGDNVYLYDNNGDLLDMAGWSSLHTQGRFMSRVPDGNGTHQGYDDSTSLVEGWVFDQLPNVLITEFSVDSPTSAVIEVYNPRGGDIVLDPYWDIYVEGGQLNGNWDVGPMPKGGYSNFTRNGGVTLDPEGDTIGLYYPNPVLIDEVSYGTKGPAPDPLIGESTGRYWDSPANAYSNDWNRNAPTGPTWGYQNDVPPIVSSAIVMNEVMFDPSPDPAGHFFVIYNTGATGIDMTDWQIVCDDIFTFTGTANGNTIYIFRYNDVPASQLMFDSMTPSGDNVYLYDDLGQRIDMVGWNTAHVTGTSAKRVPDGNGTHQGYDDTTSEMAGWVFDTPLQVIMTEFSDNEAGTAYIEVYNPWYPTIDFSSSFEFRSASTGAPLPGSWQGGGLVGADQHGVFDASSGLDSEGDTISFYQSGVLIEDISYGQMGTVPDPLPLESVARVFDTVNLRYTDMWSRNWTTPTFGWVNDVPPANFTSSVVLNEILFNPTVTADGFVEVYLRLGTLTNISGYKLVGDEVYTFPDGTELTSSDRFGYLTQPTWGPLFAEMDPNGDNVYLYDDQGSLLDMAGWSSLHTQGRSMCRVPNGTGSSDGYDDTSSVAAGWVFGCAPTIQLVKVSPQKGEKTKQWGTWNTTIYFLLTITNKQSVEDTISILSSNINGYPVQILDETGTFVITEVFLQAGSFVNITIAITLPSTIPFIEWDNITITIQSQNTTLFLDSILLEARVLPFIMPDKYAIPQQIYVSGTGHDEIATITLNITGMGTAVELKNPQDVVFCVDTSGSMSPQSLALIRTGLTGYVDEMESPDQGALVVFNTGAWLWELPSHHLTDDYDRLRDDIAAIPAPNGMTYIGSALHVAVNELLDYGDPSHIQVIILLTDGNPEGADPFNPTTEATRAANANITIFTIGLNVADPTLLQQIADMTGGQYFPVTDASEIPGIYLLISGYIGDYAGRDIDTTDAIPMVRDVLPPWIELVPGSFSIDPDYFTEVNGYTIMEWNVTQLKIGEYWEVTFQVKSTEAGLVYANDVSSSRVYYWDYFDNEIVFLFPECMLNVLAPEPDPPKLYIDVSMDRNDINLYWDPPSIPGTTHYLIYRKTSQIGFDFTTPWRDTSLHSDNGIFALRTTWNDSNAALPGHLNYEEQYYYIVRAVNAEGNASITSRTVGKYTREFEAGTSAFSLPLEPLDTIDTDMLLTDMGAGYIRWMDPATHNWRRYPDDGSAITDMKVGECYEVGFAAPTDYTFTGMPGAMIQYDDSPFGFVPTVDELTVIVNQANGNVQLSWPQIGGIDRYFVYNSSKRDGFWGTLGQDYELLVTLLVGNELFIDTGAAVAGTERYYMIVPDLSTSTWRGSGSYSVGVWTGAYDAGYDTFALPLKLLTAPNSVDWYCNALNDIWGMNYYNVPEQRWMWHKTIMPFGIYDVDVVMCDGYQISTTASTKYSFIGI